MASYRSIDPVILLNAGLMTGTSKITSTPMDIGHMDKAAFMATFTGTPVGSFAIEVSIDGNTWSVLTDATIDAAAGVAGTRAVNLWGVAFRYVRMSYTNASSSGVLTVVGCAKGL